MTCENCIKQNEIDPNIHIISGGPFDSQQECLNSESKNKAYFIVEDIGSRNFVIELDNIELIDSARKQIIGLEPKKHIMGNIVKSTIWYNPDYSYYIDPSSISFFEVAMEVCDATFEYTEQHLSEAGGAFLPGLTLCPWTSYIFEEIDAPSPLPESDPDLTPEVCQDCSTPESLCGRWIDGPCQCEQG